MEDLDLFSFGQRFSTEEDCLKFLEEVRWPNGVICPHCSSTNVPYRYRDGKHFKCSEKQCHKQFTATSNTIFADTHIPLAKWLLAIYLLASRQEGTSSVQLARDLKVTQKSAWLMLQGIRTAMNDNQ
jgi:transposase-like protein